MGRKKTNPVKGRIRKDKYSDQQRRDFLDILDAKGGNISQACEATGVARRTFYTWLDNHKWFKELYEDLKDKDLDESESLHKMHRKGSPKYLWKPQVKDGKLQYDSRGRPIHVQAVDGNGKPIIIGWLIEPKQSAVEFHLRTQGKGRGWSESESSIPPIILDLKLDGDPTKLPPQDEELPPDSATA